MQKVSLDEIFRMAADIINSIGPLLWLAIGLGISFNLMIRILMIRIFRAIQSPFGYSETSYDKDPRNYQLRKFDALVEEIKKLSPPETLLRSLPIYRQSLENTSNFTTEVAQEARARILDMVGDIHDKLVEAQSIKAVSKSKATLEDLTEQIAKLDDNLSALIEVKLEEK